MAQKMDLHVVSATAIIFKNSKVLIAQRHKNEKVWPSFWTVPGGKIEYDDYKNMPKNKEGLWYNAIELSLRREVKEEVGLEIKNIDYVCDMTFLRPDGNPGIILSFMADWKKGKVKLCSELENFKWVDLKEAKNYQLIDGIYGEIVLAYKLKAGKRASRLIYA
ncbi:MAG: NUDIX domain-containing protein [Candidatus Berkelbacteria bacterium]|nr:NUDIX domain-containing protein [Candidatus Berkelbacteria bacterium]